MKKLLILIISSILLFTGCQDKLEKNKVMTEKNSIVKNEETKGLISREKARKIAVDAFKKYLNKEIIEDTSIKDAAAVGNKILVNPLSVRIDLEKSEYDVVDKAWGVYWVNEKNNIVYDCTIDAKTGRVLGIERRGGRESDAKNENIKINIKEYKEIALDFINKNDLIDKNYNITLFDISNWDNQSYVHFEFRYDIDKFFWIDIDKKTKNAISFSNMLLDSYNIEKNANNLKIDKKKAEQIILSSIEKYFDKKVDTKNLLQDIMYIKSENAWFISWRDIKALENGQYRYYTGNVDAITGKHIYIGYREGTSFREELSMSLEEAKKIVVDYAEKNNLIDNNKDIKLVKEESHDLSRILLIYKYDKNKSIDFYVDIASKKVQGLALEKQLH